MLRAGAVSGLEVNLLGQEAGGQEDEQRDGRDCGDRQTTERGGGDLPPENPAMAMRFAVARRGHGASRRTGRGAPATDGPVRPASAVVRLFVSFYNPLYQVVAHDVGAGQQAEPHPGHRAEDLLRMTQARDLGSEADQSA